MNLPGYDEWLEAPYMRQDDDIEDEGWAVLESAKSYLKPRADADEDEQLIGDYEAWFILDACIDKIKRDYECRFCGHSMNRKDRYCSRACYKADHEGW